MGLFAFFIKRSESWFALKPDSPELENALKLAQSLQVSSNSARPFDSMKADATTSPKPEIELSEFSTQNSPAALTAGSKNYQIFDQN
jgi:hypothetical protein